jgi:hypothetical protein
MLLYGFAVHHRVLSAPRLFGVVSTSQFVSVFIPVSLVMLLWRPPRGPHARDRRAAERGCTKRTMSTSFIRKIPFSVINPAEHPHRRGPELDGTARQLPRRPA